MRASKTLLTAVLALLVGFIVAQVITSCRSPERNVLPPRPIKVAEVLSWEPIDPRIGTLELTIPGKLCKPSRGTHKLISDTWIVTVDSEVTCPVNPQTETGSPITYYYKHIIRNPRLRSMQTIVKAPDVANAQGQQSSIQVIDIVGSCDGCDRLPGLHTNPSEITDEIECYNINGKQTPVVVDDDGNMVKDLSVPLGISRITWMAQGGYGAPTIAFQGETPPPLCNLTSLPNSQQMRCDVNDAARDGNAHHYTVALPRCSEAPSSDYTLTPVATPPQTPPGNVDKHKK